MKWLTKSSDIKCDHGGKVVNIATQSLVFIRGNNVLVAPDPERKAIALCPNQNVAAGMKPCLLTLSNQQGYSDFISIEGRAICLDTLKGLTDGTPPGSIHYTVKNPKQIIVEEIG